MRKRMTTRDINEETVSYGVDKLTQLGRLTGVFGMCGQDICSYIYMVYVSIGRSAYVPAVFQWLGM